MLDVTCYDAHGFPIEYLTQWDCNRVAVLDGIDLTPQPRVRFRNKYSESSIVVRATVDGSRVRATIPNHLLIQPYPIILEVFYEYEDGSVVTRFFFTIPVVPSKRPEDFALTNNVEYKDWVAVKEEAESRIYMLETEKDGEFLVIATEEPEENDILWFNTKQTNSDE